MFVVAEVLILAAALIVATARSLRGPVFFPIRALAVVYVDLVRGIPLLLMILVLGFGIPALDIPGVPRSALFWGVTALVISYTAYTAEIYRAGIESVHESQRMSAQSLGLTQVQALRHVLVPQAVRNVIPALAEQLREPPEGRGPGVCPRRPGRCEGSSDLQLPDFQLHRLHRRHSPVPGSSASPWPALPTGTASRVRRRRQAMSS